MGIVPLFQESVTKTLEIQPLALATQIGEGAISLLHAQSNDLYASYLRATEDADQAQRLYDLLCYNLKHQSGNPTQADPIIVPPCSPATL